MPSNRKPKPQLPDIKACPQPGCRGVPRMHHDSSDDFCVWCNCDWRGPRLPTERSAILAWNRRIDAEAERRGAMAALAYLDNCNGEPFSFAADALRLAIECGEVTGKAAKPEPWIVCKPGVMGGKPCVRGTRITVETLQAVYGDWDRAEILRQYPELTRESLAAALAYKLPGKRGGR